jgi:hypothetical protein
MHASQLNQSTPAARKPAVRPIQQVDGTTRLSRVPEHRLGSANVARPNRAAWDSSSDDFLEQSTQLYHSAALQTPFGVMLVPGVSPFGSVPTMPARRPERKGAGNNLARFLRAEASTPGGREARAAQARVAGHKQHVLHVLLDEDSNKKCGADASETGTAPACRARRHCIHPR